MSSFCYEKAAFIVKHKIDDRPDNIITAINMITGFKAYRNREILKARYVEGYTHEEIAEMFDMSPRQIKKICYDLEPFIIDNLRVED